MFKFKISDNLSESFNHNFVLMWQRLPKWIRNKYAITIIAFVVWLLFFDQYDLITQYSYHNKIKQLNKEEIYFQGKLAKAKAELNELSTNNIALEHYAREKYYMKKPNEDVFVIVPKQN